MKYICKRKRHARCWCLCLCLPKKTKREEGEKVAYRYILLSETRQTHNKIAHALPETRAHVADVFALQILSHFPSFGECTCSIDEIHTLEAARVGV